LIEPRARAALSTDTLAALQGSMAGAMHNVFWVGTAMAAMALLVSLRLPRKGDRSTGPPSEDSCCAETGERMVMAELTTLDPEHEPVAAQAD
jgi:hypothetical protein